MRNYKGFILLLPLAIASVASLSACKKKENVRVLRILNCEDYIYEYNPTPKEEAQWNADMEELGVENYKKDVMDQFIDSISDYWAETHNGEKLDYVYDTFDTNETMFNELQTGKTTYDVIVPSDYMIQKLISNNMLHKISDNSVWDYISPYLIDKFESITATYTLIDVKAGEINTYTDPIADYAVPYMWGTVGMMYNPSYYIEKYPELTEDDVHALFSDWDSLYSSKYIKGSYSIKDSVRDTYAVSLIHTYRDEISKTDDPEVLDEIFNRHSEKEMAKIKEDMINLKNSAFGFECDSGKSDMVDQKIGANMCWSGDATWAITEARNDDPKKNVDLYYSIPTNYGEMENGGASNIWFDGLCMPKNTDHEDNLNDDEKAQYELGELFIKFMSNPEIALQNCYCVGYTPGVAGDRMLDYMMWCYDISEDLEEGAVLDEDYVDYDLSYFYSGSLENPDDYEDEEGRIIIKADPDDAMRELAAQYPQDEILSRLAIMKNFGSEGNARLLDMWEQVRTNPLPLWGIIVLAVEAGCALIFVSYLVIHKVNRKRDKRERKN